MGSVNSSSKGAGQEIVKKTLMYNTDLSMGTTCIISLHIGMPLKYFELLCEHLGDLTIVIDFTFIIDEPLITDEVLNSNSRATRFKLQKIKTEHAKKSGRFIVLSSNLQSIDEEGISVTRTPDKGYADVVIKFSPPSEGAFYDAYINAEGTRLVVSNSGDKIKSSTVLEITDPVKAGVTIEPNDVLLTNIEKFNINNHAYESLEYFVGYQPPTLAKAVGHLYTVIQRKSVCVVYDLIKLNKADIEYFRHILMTIAESMDRLVSEQNTVQFILNATKVSTTEVKFAGRTMTLPTSPPKGAYQFAMHPDGTITAYGLMDGIVMKDFITHKGIEDNAVEIFTNLPKIMWTTSFTFDLAVFEISDAQKKILIMLILHDAPLLKRFIMTMKKGNDPKLSDFIITKIKNSKAIIFHVRTDEFDYIHNIPGFNPGDSIYSDMVMRVGVHPQDPLPTILQSEIVIDNERGITSSFNVKEQKIMPIVGTPFKTKSYYFLKPIIELPKNMDYRLQVYIIYNPNIYILLQFIKFLDFKMHKRYIFIIGKTSDSKIPYDGSLVGIDVALKHYGLEHLLFGTNTCFYNKASTKDVSIRLYGGDMLSITYGVNTMKISPTLNNKSANLRLEMSSIIKYKLFGDDVIGKYTSGFSGNIPLDMVALWMQPMAAESLAIKTGWQTHAQNQTIRTTVLLTVESETQAEKLGDFMKNFITNNGKTTTVIFYVVVEDGGGFDATKYFSDGSEIVTIGKFTVAMYYNKNLNTWDAKSNTMNSAEFVSVKLVETASEVDPKNTSQLQIALARDERNDQYHIGITWSPPLDVNEDSEFVTGLTQPILFVTSHKIGSFPRVDKYAMVGTSTQQPNIVSIYNNTHNSFLELDGFKQDSWAERDVCLIVRFREKIYIKNGRALLEENIGKYMQNSNRVFTSMNFTGALSDVIGICNTPATLVNNFLSFNRHVIQVTDLKDDIRADASAALSFQPHQFYSKDGAGGETSHGNGVRLIPLLYKGNQFKITGLSQSYHGIYSVSMLSSVQNDELGQIYSIIKEKVDFNDVFIARTTETVNIPGISSGSGFVCITGKGRVATITKEGSFVKFNIVEAGSKLGFVFGLWTVDTPGYSPTPTHNVDFMINSKKMGIEFTSDLNVYSTHRLAVMTNYFELSGLDPILFKSLYYFHHKSTTIVFLRSIEDQVITGINSHLSALQPDPVYIGIHADFGKSDYHIAPMELCALLRKIYNVKCIVFTGKWQHSKLLYTKSISFSDNLALIEDDFLQIDAGADDDPIYVTPQPTTVNFDSISYEQGTIISKLRSNVPGTGFYVDKVGNLRYFGNQFSPTAKLRTVYYGFTYTLIFYHKNPNPSNPHPETTTKHNAAATFISV